jgi:hypothetical protein
VTLALAILASLAVAALVARWAARSATRWRPLQTLLVALAPLAAFAVLVRSAPPRSGGYALRVTGQYAPLADTITLGGAGADVRLPVATPGAGGARVRLWYDRAARLARVRVDSGLAPVSFDGRPVNALPLAHGTRVTLQSSPGLTVTAALPAWPAGCLLRVERLCAERALTVTDGETVRQLTVRVGRAGVPAGALDDPRLARAPFLLMTAGRRVWVVANPAGPVRVDGQRLPSAASAPADGDPGEGRGPELRVAPASRRPRCACAPTRSRTGSRSTSSAAPGASGGRSPPTAAASCTASSPGPRPAPARCACSTSTRRRR